MLRRRKWIIVLALVLVPAAALAYSFHQRTLYHASADVLINQNNIVQSIAAGSAVVQSVDPQRFLDTQAALAREPEVARRVLVAEKSNLTVDEFLRNSSVHSKQGANLLEFGVTNHNAAAARGLAAAYAEQYERFEHEVSTSALQAALDKVQARIRAVGRDSSVYPSLSSKADQLETLLTLQTSTASVVRVPDSANKVQPRPVRTGIFGLALGLIVALGLALLRDALDTKVRTAKEVTHETGLPLLARLPAPARALSRSNRLVMLQDPYSAQSEPYRALRVNVEYSLQDGPRTIMVTSALEREGKSTTIANLAVALARGGHRVTLVDLDLRRPFVHRFFGHDGTPGISDVVLGQATLQEALFEIAVPTRNEPLVRPVNGNGTAKAPRGGRAADRSGRAQLRPLAILPAGQLPPDPGEFVGSKAVADVLTELRSRNDIILIDTPPLFHVSDALVLGDAVDDLILVSRIGFIRRAGLPELHRLLNLCPATKIGVILTGADEEEGLEYGYGYGYEYRPRGRPRLQRDEMTTTPLRPGGTVESAPRTSETGGATN